MVAFLEEVDIALDLAKLEPLNEQLECLVEPPTLAVPLREELNPVKLSLCNVAQDAVLSGPHVLNGAVPHHRLDVPLLVEFGLLPSHGRDEVSERPRSVPSSIYTT